MSVKKPPIARFSSTVRRENTRRPSGTTAMLLRMMCEDGWPTSSSPRYLMLPLCACGEPHRVISKVDLPAPLAPIRVTISP
ncbi:hypothetical protein D3C86_2069230 [compost metagenome]